MRSVLYMKAEHARKLGRLFVGGPAAFEAFKKARTAEAATKALDRIVRDNEPFIAAVVRDLKAHGLGSPMNSVVELSDDDLLQAARIGYAEAIRKFDPERGALPGYAKKWILSKVTRAANGDATIHKPEQSMIPAAALRAAEMVETLTGRHATAEEMGITEERLAAWQALPRVVGRFREGASGMDLFDSAISEDPGPEDLVVCKELAALVDTLPPKPREVLRLLYWEGMILAEVAEELGIPEEVVLDLRDEGLDALHAELS